MLRKYVSSFLLHSTLPEAVIRTIARKRITVLGYHRIMEEPPRDYPLNETVFSATPAEFQRELRYCKRHFDVISMRELLAGLQNPASLPPRPAVITFDDGYTDNARTATPLLREAGLTACFFICTNMVGTRNLPWQEEFVCCLKNSRKELLQSPFGADDAPYDLRKDQVAASISRFRKRLGFSPWSKVQQLLEWLREETRVDYHDYFDEPLFMSWDEARSMHAQGMEIGGHTRNHPVLGFVDSPAVLEHELRGCYKDIQRELEYAPISFSYPWGGIPESTSAETDRLLQEAGFQITFSYQNFYAPRAPRKTYGLERLHTEFGSDFGAFRLGMLRTALRKDSPRALAY